MVKSGQAAKYFKNLELKPVTYRMIEVAEEGEDQVSLPVPKTKREARAATTA
jgi:hypothetical protein